MTTENHSRDVPQERAQFRALVLGNPNYFGNVPESPFESVLDIQSNTTHEEIGCVGFQQQFNRLEAVVFVKQEVGYGGDVCSAGTPEYVRFYLSFDAGATWQDQGMASFQAYDIPGEKPLEYAVTLDIDPKEEFCFVENLPTVRAILSWNNPPPPNTPGFSPVWGNVLEARIQIDPLESIIWEDLKEVQGVELPQNVEAVLDSAQPLAATKLQALNATELQELYRETDVPEHRFLFAQVQTYIDNPELIESLMKPGAPGLLPELDIDFGDLLGKLLQTDGNTGYEELRCVGLNPNQNVLVGVLTVKQPNGYSGSLCTPGSQEYVAFWIDWADGTGWGHVGTTSVTIHDISNIPPEGLQYAVFLPVDPSSRRQPCEKGALTPRVRAILSWQVPPPPNNPDYVPTWGNREETLIHISSGLSIPSDDYTPFIESVSGQAVCNIDQATGMAAGEKPFGGVINITGFVPGPPDVFTPNPLKYRVSVRELPPLPNPPGPWQPLANSFGIPIIEQIGGGLPVGYNAVQAIDPSDGFYTYREDPNPAGGGWRLVQNRLLAQWITAAPMTGLWEIKIEVKEPVSGQIFIAGTIECVADGSTRSNVMALLDEVTPTANVQITGFSRGGGPIQPAADCETFQVGDVIYGTYSTFDEHFGSLSLSAEPSAPAHGATVNPATRAYPIVPTTGETGNWSLDTSAMDPCGYIVRLYVVDRTIVSGDASGWKNAHSVGFCLVAASE